MFKQFTKKIKLQYGFQTVFFVSYKIEGPFTQMCIAFMSMGYIRQCQKMTSSH